MVLVADSFVVGVGVPQGAFCSDVEGDFENDTHAAEACDCWLHFASSRVVEHSVTDVARKDKPRRACR